MKNLNKHELRPEELLLIRSMGKSYIDSIATMGTPEEIQEIKQLSITVQNKKNKAQSLYS